MPGCEERSPDPKPRWNPRPEQIRILEAIFNSGMVNPPRDEIRKIRAQLQEYGQVGDANVSLQSQYLDPLMAILDHNNAGRDVKAGDWVGGAGARRG